MCAFQGDTKTYVDPEDGLSVAWDAADRLVVWAENAAGHPVLNAQTFSVYGCAGARAFFTATLSAPMGDGEYLYYACSPQPVSAQYPVLTFENPSLQDGRGAGVMVSGKVTGPALKPIAESSEEDMPRLRMRQCLHLFKCYVVDDNGLLQGESIQRIQLKFPKPVCGTFTQDLFQPQAGASLSVGANDLTIALAQPVSASTGDVRNYAFATLVPCSWEKSDMMSARIYSETKILDVEDIPLGGRTIKAGHATPVRLVPVRAKNRCTVYFTYVSNELGEDVKTITLTAPSGCKWGDNGGNTYVIGGAGKTLRPGDTYLLEYENEAAFRTLAGKTITVTYDSDHVRMNRSVTFPSTGLSADIRFVVPALLNENFSKVPTFSSYDEYSSTFNLGSKDPYAFLNGWTGGRVGGSAGRCIRIACRRETTADYDARVDSAPLNATLKKATNLRVSFDYGANNKFGGIPIITDGNVGQTCYIGYVTDTKGYKSGDTDGTFNRDKNKFYVKEYTGSYTNTPNSASFVLAVTPAGQTVRVSWRTEVEHQEGTHNTTCWLYLDNIKVTVAK